MCPSAPARVPATAHGFGRIPWASLEVWGCSSRQSAGRAAAAKLFSLSRSQADEGGTLCRSGLLLRNGTSRSSLSLDAEKFKLNRAIAKVQAATKLQSQLLSY